MQKLTLILSLRDPSTTLQNRIIAYLVDEHRLPSLEGRGDVVLIGDNAILLDQITAHEIFVQVCAGLGEKHWPYLVLPLDSEICVVCGNFPEKVSAILEKYGVLFAKPTS